MKIKIEFYIYIYIFRNIFKMIIKTCKISFLHQATQNMTWKSYLPRLSHTLLQWQPCRLVAGLANIWDRTSPNRNEMKVKSPNRDYLSLFVQPMISSWYLFKTCILGAKRDWDWEINASVRQYFKATVFARKQQRFLPHQLPERITRRRQNNVFCNQMRTSGKSRAAARCRRRRLQKWCQSQNQNKSIDQE